MATPAPTMGRFFVRAASLFLLLTGALVLVVVAPSRSSLTFLSPGGGSSGAAALRGRLPSESLPAQGSNEPPRRRSPGSDSLAGAMAAGSLAPWLSAAVGAWAVAAAVRRARHGATARRNQADAGIGIGRLHQTAIVPCGKIRASMTRPEEDDFLETRAENLRKQMPMSPEEFEDTVEELTWQWGRHLLPYMDPRRRETAAHKRKTIMKSRDLYDTLRLFKPLSMKYPTLMKRLNISGKPDLEDTSLEINPEWIANEEEVAGFTYEDFAAETEGNTFEKWGGFKEGDLVTGKVAAMNNDGAFVEVGAKTWAFLPLKSISLSPIASPSEKLSIGDEIEAKVVAIGADSMIKGDGQASQIIISLTDLQRVSAWDQINKIIRGDEGYSPIMKVQVKQMRTWGAVVQTEFGIDGIIPNSQLADKVGDMKLVGETIPVQIFALRKEFIDVVPMRPSEYALTLSYKKAASMELAKTVEEGQVLEATVMRLNESGVDLDVQGIRCSLRRVDITSAPSLAFQVSKIFEIGEVIKAYVVSTQETSGEVRLSTRALEPKRGAMITNKELVFERAEETAAKYLASSTEAKAKVQFELDQALLADGDEDLDGPKKSGSIIDSIDSDEDSDDIF